MRARYDGHADWYDATFAQWRDDPDVVDFVNRGLESMSGALGVDVGCGTGLHASHVRSRGIDMIGLDASADQLRHACVRLPVIQADAVRLPFRSDVVALMLAMFVHTDIADWSACVREIARCLAPGGRFVCVGLHPCFIGQHVVRTTEAIDEQLTFRPGYGTSGWSTTGSGGGVGLWSRVGGHHKTLTGFLSPFLDSGLSLLRVEELRSGGAVLPRNIGVIVERRNSNSCIAIHAPEEFQG